MRECATVGGGERKEGKGRGIGWVGALPLLHLLLMGATATAGVEPLPPK